MTFGKALISTVVMTVADMPAGVDAMRSKYETDLQQDFQRMRQKRVNDRYGNGAKKNRSKNRSRQSTRPSTSQTKNSRTEKYPNDAKRQQLYNERQYQNAQLRTTQQRKETRCRLGMDRRSCQQDQQRYQSKDCQDFIRRSKQNVAYREDREKKTRYDPTTPYKPQPKKAKKTDIYGKKNYGKKRSIYYTSLNDK